MDGHDRREKLRRGMVAMLNRITAAVESPSPTAERPLPTTEMAAHTARSFGMASEDRSSKTPKSRDSTFFRFWSALIALNTSPLM